MNTLPKTATEINYTAGPFYSNRGQLRLVFKELDGTKEARRNRKIREAEEAAVKAQERKDRPRG